MTRLLDIVLSATALAVLSPLFAVVMIALKLTGEGEVFFVQLRVGRAGKMFGLYKFATMLKDSPNIGTGTVTLKDDPRILPFGQFLRKTKINELPQFLNVLLGDMSIIGPRPQTRRCFEAFPTESQAAIQSVRPGLSGVGSIVFRGEEGLLQGADASELLYDQVIMPYKGILEQWFVERQSVTIYLQCIWLTSIVIFKSDSDLIWRTFPDLPQPPSQLAKRLSWITGNE